MQPLRVGLMSLIVTAAAGSVQAAPKELPPGDYLVTVMVPAATGTCSPDQAIGSMVGKFRYPGPGSDGAKLVFEINDNGKLSVRELSLPTTPAADKDQWRGDFTETTLSIGKRTNDSGQLDGVLMVVDLGVALASLGINGAQCTETLDFFVTPPVQ